MRFYNQSFFDVMSMPNHWLEALYLAINTLEARESILSISNLSDNEKKKNDRKKRIDELMKIAEFEKKKTGKSLNQLISEAKSKVNG